MKEVLLIGCGKMGSALLRGWLEGLDKKTHFTVVDPELGEGRGDSLSESPRITYLKNLSESDKALSPDIIVLAIKPQMMEEALAPVVAVSRGDSLWLSIAAGISIDWLKERIASDALIIRSMPNTPSAIGAGITAMVASPNVSAEGKAFATKMLEAVGRVVQIESESDMDAVTAISGSGPAYIFLMREALEAAAIKAGLSGDIAAALAGETISGAARLMSESTETPTQLRVNVMSKGGTTEAAMKVLMAEEGGLMALMEEAVFAAKNRSEELSKS